MIGERVAHVRHYYGWSQAQLAELAGVSQPAISQIESGGAASDQTILAIARATNFAPWFFTQGALPDLPDGSLRFRKRATSLKRDDARVRAHVRQAIEALVRLESKANLPPVRVVAVGSKEQVDGDVIENLAVEARDWLGVGSQDPIPNLIRAVERAGVFVIGSAQEIPKHDAASFWPDFPDGRPLICFTRGYPGDRGRLSIGHELGHLVLHQLRKPEFTVAEEEAFRFGAALLLPKDMAFEEIETPVTLRSLAHVKARWGIAISALIRRSFDLHIIDVERRTSLERQLSARGWRKSEPVHVGAEEPALVRRLLKVTTGKVQPHHLTDDLGLPMMAIRDLVA